MNDEALTSQAPDRSRSKAHLLAKLHRYRNLLLKKWWVLALGLALGLAVEAVLSRLDPPSFVSVGRMIVSIKLAIPEGSVYTEELSNFLGTQAALMQSGVVVNRAHARVTAQKPDLSFRPVTLRVSVLPKTTIFMLQAIGADAHYTQAFLQASMEEYVLLKKEMRTQTSDTTVAGLTEEVLRLEKELRKSDDELATFQSTNSVVLQDQASSAGNYLTTLNQSLAAMKSDYDLLQSLSLDQNLERQQQTANPSPATDDSQNKSGGGADTEPSTEYLKAKQQVLVLKADQQELSHFLRPKHPKMVALSEDIARRERLLEIYKQQSVEQLESRKNALSLQIKNREKDVREWEARVLDINAKSAEFQRLKANSQRIQALYDKLLATMQTLDVNKEVSPESVTIMEKASPAFPDHPKLSKKLLTGALIGLALSIVLLMLLDRLDDRMNSFTELQEMFEETVLGQIPKERALGRSKELKLIEQEDKRDAFVEAYRNLRSSLLYMAEPGQRPKTLLVTSSVPNEGKSITSANLAITIANGGSRVLLVDADLRKGNLHSRFKVASEPGLSQVLSQGLDWGATVQTTAVPNLFLLPRGPFTPRGSEFFVGTTTGQILKEAAEAFDYIILDTAPVMAADDVTSLAPTIDGVMFVVRAEYTSARIARAALGLLYQRQVRVLGLVFNSVRPTSVDYYYYKYKDYYQAYATAAAGVKHAKA